VVAHPAGGHGGPPLPFLLTKTGMKVGLLINFNVPIFKKRNKANFKLT